jgi:hypothetical protein
MEALPASRIPGLPRGPTYPVAQRVDEPMLASGRLSSPHIAAPVGRWVKIQSTWLEAALWTPYTEEPPMRRGPSQWYGQLQIEFKPPPGSSGYGAICAYENISAKDWETLFTAPSKGKYWYQIAVREGRSYKLMRSGRHSAGGGQQRWS